MHSWVLKGLVKNIQVWGQEVTLAGHDLPEANSSILAIV